MTLIYSAVVEIHNRCLKESPSALHPVQVNIYLQPTFNQVPTCRSVTINTINSQCNKKD
ncbi:hypothetical protein KFK09_014496 [Dendrobium nobile]|uniref:Uncharacterized protein n=1 Tax=Dendrobium nobile TaxID=94219 RepID=A0A8T3B3B4_DENNO|nr:hypothetical protein KFK09_014496 [Dendrobium nobile]